MKGVRSPQDEARFAKAEIERDSVSLGLVERDARASGYLLLARRAAEARR
jgi:hypothetical protein